MKSLVEKRVTRPILKSATALHGVGRARFSTIPSIHDSEDAYMMIDEMRRIVAMTPLSDHDKEVRLRIISFFKQHGIKE